MEWPRLPVEQEGDPPYLPMWTDSFAVFSDSDNPAEAADFVAFLATEGQRLRVEVTGQPPLSASAAEEFGRADQGNTEGRQEFLQTVASGSALMFVPGFGNVVSPLEDAFNQMAAGEVTADILDELAPRMQESLNEQWATWDRSAPDRGRCSVYRRRIAAARPSIKEEAAMPIRLRIRG